MPLVVLVGTREVVPAQSGAYAVYASEPTKQVEAAMTCDKGHPVYFRPQSNSGRNGHFAHYRGATCVQYLSAGMSTWHKQWQAAFDAVDERTEVSIGRNRADVVLSDGRVVELQHSSLGERRTRQRNLAYGPNLTYVFALRRKTKWYHGGGGVVANISHVPLDVQAAKSRLYLATADVTFKVLGASGGTYYMRRVGRLLEAVQDIRGPSHTELDDITVQKLDSAFGDAFRAARAEFLGERRVGLSPDVIATIAANAHERAMKLAEWGAQCDPPDTGTHYEIDHWRRYQ